MNLQEGHNSSYNKSSGVGGQKPFVSMSQSKKGHWENELMKKV
jgi:hypothetical protein